MAQLGVAGGGAAIGAIAGSFIPGVGTMLVIQPLAILLAAPIFVVAILLTRYVSLGSLLGSAAILPAMLLIAAVATGAVPPAYLAWAAVGPALVWLAHRDSIVRCGAFSSAHPCRCRDEAPDHAAVSAA